MLQNIGNSITVVLPMENEYRWLSDLYAMFPRPVGSDPGRPPPGWASAWQLVVVTAGASDERMASALAPSVDLVVVDGVEALSTSSRRSLAATEAFDVGHRLHDPLIHHARRTDAVVIGGIDTSTDPLPADQQSGRDGTLELSSSTRITRSEVGSRRLVESPHGWTLGADS